MLPLVSIAILRAALMAVFTSYLRTDILTTSSDKIKAALNGAFEMTDRMSVKNRFRNVFGIGDGYDNRRKNIRV